MSSQTVLPVATIDGTWTVNQVVVHYPETLSTLDALGIDSCCGGAATVQEAARTAGVPAETLLVALADTLRAHRAGGGR